MGQTGSMNVRVQHKHDTEANWLLATTFAPKAGELIIYDVDSNHSTPRVKVGDGSTLVADLPFSVENSFTNEEKEKLADLPTEIQEVDTVLFTEYSVIQVQNLWNSINI